MSLRMQVVRRDVPGALGAILLELAAEYGLEPQQVLAGTAIDEIALSVPETRISVRDQTRMLENCIAASGEAGLALIYGSRIPVVALGVLGYALMSCRDVRELLEVLVRYHRLIAGGFRITIDGDSPLLGIRLVGGLFDAAVQPIDCEVFYAAAAASLRQLGVTTEGALHASVSYPAPPHAELYRRLVCRDMRFGAPENRLEFDRRVLAMPLQFANPTLLRLYRQQCDQMLATLTRSAEYTAEVRSLLLAQPGRFPGFEEAAERLHVSPRTLRRRLDEEGTTYLRIVHELRRQLAETYLRDSMLSIAEIADMLGYNDQSNFRRAFMSWTGRSPAGYRRSLRSQRTPGKPGQAPS